MNKLEFIPLLLFSFLSFHMTNTLCSEKKENNNLFQLDMYPERLYSVYHKLSDVYKEIEEIKKKVDQKEFEGLFKAMVFIRETRVNEPARWRDRLCGETLHFMKKYPLIKELVCSDSFFNLIKDRTAERSDERALRKIFDESHKESNGRNDLNEKNDLVEEAASSSDYSFVNLPAYYKLSDMHQKIQDLKKEFGSEKVSSLFRSSLKPLPLNIGDKKLLDQALKQNKTIDNFYSVLREKTKEDTNEGALKKFLNGSY